jgi:hypothetical protein
MTVDALKKIGYEVVITSDQGTLLKEGSNPTLKATLYLNGEPYSGTSSIGYQWYDANGNNIDGAIREVYSPPSIQFVNGYIQYGCKITVSEKEDGEDGI